MKQIELNNEQVALVDDEDYWYLMNWKWFALKGENTYYVMRSLKPQVYMHNFIMDKIGVDHIDKNGLNNQRSNLRIATQSQNMANTSSRGGTSKYKGVFWASGRWRVQIKVNYKSKDLGRFDSEIEAALAYNEAAKLHFGEFANLNKI